MFAIRIWGNYKNEPGAIGIKCKNLRKEIGYTIQNVPFKKLITTFVVNLVFHHVGLAWIV